MAAVAILAFVILIAPVYVDPLCNTYKPLADGPVKESIHSLARASGILSAKLSPSARRAKRSGVECPIV